MVSQLELFSQREPLSPPRAKALARATDPESSHEAAASMAASGAAKAQAEMVCDLVWMAPGSTADELAELSKKVHGADALDRVRVGKRLPHIQGIAAGEIRKCRVTGRKCQTWGPV